MAKGTGVDKKSNLKIPLFVALDVDSDAQALKLAEKVSTYVGGYKIGPRLTMKYGASIVEKLSKIGPVFVDNKFHDIPSTVLAAVKSAHEMGASYATVHASNGRECLSQLAQLEKELNKSRFFKLLSVTVLTSFNDRALPANWQKQSTLKHVESLAEETIAAKLSGLVCSPEEVKSLRAKYPNAFLVTPGIRLPQDEKGDQTRVMGPCEALDAGASALVVGRPIVEAKDPRVAAKIFCELIKSD